MDDAGLVNAELDLTSLGVLDSGGDVGGHGANLGVRHQATGAQHGTQGTHDTHRVRGGDHHVEVDVATLDLLGQVFHADEIGTGSLGFFSLGTLGEHSDALGLAGAVRHHDGATHHLIRLLGVHAQLHSHVDGFIELGAGAFLDDAQSVFDSVQLGRFDLAFESLLALGQLSHITHPPR